MPRGTKHFPTRALVSGSFLDPSTHHMRTIGSATLAPVALAATLLARGATVVTCNYASVGPLPARPLSDCEHCHGLGLLAVTLFDGRTSVSHCTCVAARAHEREQEACRV